MEYGEEDLDILFEDAGVSVIYGSTKTMGLLDDGMRDDQDEAGIISSVRVRSLVVKTGVLSLTVDAEIAVDGTVYRVRDWDPVEPDNALTEIVLVEP